MNIIKNFREQLGLSQQDLASYLSIAKSQISMVESGLRDLPTPALIKLAFFEQASLTMIDDLSQNHVPDLSEYVKLILIKITQKEKKLLAVKTSYNQGLRLLQAVKKSKETIPANKEGKKDEQWLAIQEAIAIKKINDNNTEAQKLLQIQIKAMKFEMKLVTESK